MTTKARAYNVHSAVLDLILFGAMQVNQAKFVEGYRLGELVANKKKLVLKRWDMLRMGLTCPIPTWVAIDKARNPDMKAKLEDELNAKLYAHFDNMPAERIC